MTPPNEGSGSFFVRGQFWPAGGFVERLKWFRESPQTRRLRQQRFPHRHRRPSPSTIRRARALRRNRAPHYQHDRYHCFSSRVRMESNRCPQKDKFTRYFRPDEYPRCLRYRTCHALEFRPPLLLVVRPRRRMCSVRRRSSLAGCRIEAQKRNLKPSVDWRYGCSRSPNHPYPQRRPLRH